MGPLLELFPGILVLMYCTKDSYNFLLSGKGNRSAYFRTILPSTASEFLRDGQSDDITSRCLFGDLKTFFGAYKESDGIVFKRLKEFCNRN